MMPQPEARCKKNRNSGQSPNIVHRNFAGCHIRCALGMSHDKIFRATNYNWETDLTCSLSPPY